MCNMKTFVRNKRTLILKPIFFQPRRANLFFILIWQSFISLLYFAYAENFSESLPEVEKLAPVELLMKKLIVGNWRRSKSEQERFCSFSRNSTFPWRLLLVVKNGVLNNSCYLFSTIGTVANRNEVTASTTLKASRSKIMEESLVPC